MDDLKIIAIADAFKIRASASIEICGAMGLTEKQQISYDTLLTRKNDPAAKSLTAKMEADLKTLQDKKDNPELPEMAKTYCKKWLKEYLYHRRKSVKSKYLDKGNMQEEDGFTLMCLELNLGMVYKNTQYHSNEWAQGTDDLFVKNIVYDNKCSWDLDTFPMFETEISDDRYEWQINTYCELRSVDDGVLCYTLIDAPIELIEREVKWLTDHNDIYKRVCEMVYTKAYFDELKLHLFPDATFDYFVEIPQAERIAPFPIKRDPKKIETLKERVPMCRNYIISLLKAKYHGK